jgi:hypothetical protein
VLGGFHRSWLHLRESEGRVRVEAADSVPTEGLSCSPSALCYSRGMRIENVLPWPRTDSTLIVPP